MTCARTTSALFLMLLAGCDADNGVTTHGDPPFSIDKAGTVLWAEDPGNDQRDGIAVLLISDDPIDCGDITSQNFYYDLDEVVLEGQGLMFLLRYDSWGSDAPPLDWEGLWMSGYAYGGDAYRTLFPMAFSDGFLYFLGGYYGIGDSSWLDVVAYASGGVSGSYATEYWSGEFYAENCGAWAGEPDDTYNWWDTDTWWWDTDTWTWVEPEVDTVTYSVDAVEWNYSVEFSGWVYDAGIVIHGQHDGAEWDEEHDLVNTDYDPDGQWDIWEHSLPITSSWEDQESGANTLFTEDDHDTMTWMVTGYDDHIAPCAVWGAEPEWFDSYDCELLSF